MKIIYKSRNSGKTEALIEWVRAGRSIISGRPLTPVENNRVMAVHSTNEYNRVRRQYDLTDDEVVTYTTYRYNAGHRLYKNKQVAIDNIEKFLYAIMGDEIYGVTITKEEDDES